ncbi:hybrid signal transduction histidine kinase M [Tanacetum coccineum]
MGASTNDATSSDPPPPPTAEWLTIDFIVLAWIFTTLSKTLQQRLVAELRSMKLGDLSIDAYFHKIESIATILSSLGSPIRNDDVVKIALDGLPDTCQHVSDIIIHQETFPDLKTVRFILTTAEMRLKSRAQTTYVDSTSSSPIVLLSNFGTNARRFTSSTKKVNKPCFNFNKGSCRFGDHCKFLHNGVHGNPSLWSNSVSRSTVIAPPTLTQTDMVALTTLLAKLGINGSTTCTQSTSNVTVPTSHGITFPLALHTARNESSPSYVPYQPSSIAGPQGFPLQLLAQTMTYPQA